MQNKLYVGNLNYRVTKDELTNLFAPHGNIVEVKIPKDPESGQARGFAFVTFEDAASAEVVIEKLNGTNFLDRPLKINVAIERQDRNRNNNRSGGRQFQEDREYNR